MRRRVLLMISSLRGGGSEKQTLLLLRHLDRSRFEPHLYLLHSDGELTSEVPDDVPVHAYGHQPPAPWFYLPGRVHRDQVRRLSELIKRESIGVVYDRTFHMTLIAGPACRQQSVPRVSTIVSPPESAVPLVEQRFVRAKQRRLAIAYRQSRATLAVSQAAARSAQRYYGLGENQIHVVPNPVDIQQVQSLAGAYPVQRDARLTLVCVGRMTEEKGHRDLIEALSRCGRQQPQRSPMLRLWMIGDGVLRDALTTQAAGLPATVQVEFLGQLTNPAPYIAAADALILPSRFEGMPNVVLEAMALETPVIATRTGGTVELERDQPTILWSSAGDPGSIANAIAALMVDRDAAERRVKSAKRLIESFHDPAEIVGRIERYLD